MPCQTRWCLSVNYLYSWFFQEFSCVAHELLIWISVVIQVEVGSVLSFTAVIPVMATEFLFTECVIHFVEIWLAEKALFNKFTQLFSSSLPLKSRNEILLAQVSDVLWGVYNVEGAGGSMNVPYSISNQESVVGSYVKMKIVLPDYCE